MDTNASYVVRTLYVLHIRGDMMELVVDRSPMDVDGFFSTRIYKSKATVMTNSAGGKFTTTVWMPDKTVGINASRVLYCEEKSAWVVDDDL